ncbi:hypothetical protein DPX16_8966 [Anabarilius grahami]|uniref:Uncharacterized protein n=1 Tax=Anabarilius grahami TaxID=495550 RepID=A0A3N0XCN4_ANAGA|nr:hypothetical protein DPX16_8966 [Anabarilius grahami]
MNYPPSSGSASGDWIEHPGVSVYFTGRRVKRVHQQAFGSRKSLNDAGGVEQRRDLASRERDLLQTDLYLLFLFGAKQSRMWGIISCREMTFMERRKKRKWRRKKSPRQREA